MPDPRWRELLRSEDVNVRTETVRDLKAKRATYAIFDLASQLAREPDETLAVLIMDLMEELAPHFEETDRALQRVASDESKPVELRKEAGKRFLRRQGFIAPIDLLDSEYRRAWLRHQQNHMPDLYVEFESTDVRDEAERLLLERFRKTDLRCMRLEHPLRLRVYGSREDQTWEAVARLLLEQLRGEALGLPALRG